MGQEFIDGNSAGFCAGMDCLQRCVFLVDDSCFGLEHSPHLAPLDPIGSAKDIWTAFREGRFGNSPTPFLGYFFLLEDRAKVKAPVANKEPYFSVDPEFRGEARKSRLGVDKFQGISYCKRYELLCRRLVLERLYSSACFIMATNDRRTEITQPADDLTFHRFVAALKGHVVTFMGSKR